MIALPSTGDGANSTGSDTLSGTNSPSSSVNTAVDHTGHSLDSFPYRGDMIALPGTGDGSNSTGSDSNTTVDYPGNGLNSFFQAIEISALRGASQTTGGGDDGTNNASDNGIFDTCHSGLNIAKGGEGSGVSEASEGKGSGESSKLHCGGYRRESLNE
jgi:hypothetical protein